MIDPAGLFLLGCWVSGKAYEWMTRRPDLLTQLTKDAERF
jgi:hypothetical protein